MTTRAVSGLATVILTSSLASAQPVSVDQITSAAKHVADVEQVPSTRVERRGAAASSGLSGDGGEATTAPGAAAPAARRNARSTIDADEIARLLGAGQAASIDAAAAIATGAVEAQAVSGSEAAAPPRTEDANLAEPAVIAPGEPR